MPQVIKVSMSTKAQVVIVIHGTFMGLVLVLVKFEEEEGQEGFYCLENFETFIVS